MTIVKREKVEDEEEDGEEEESDEDVDESRTEPLGVAVGERSA